MAGAPAISPAVAAPPSAATLNPRKEGVTGRLGIAAAGFWAVAAGLIRVAAGGLGKAGNLLKADAGGLDADAGLAAALGLPTGVDPAWVSNVKWPGDECLSGQRKTRRDIALLESWVVTYLFVQELMSWCEILE